MSVKILPVALLWSVVIISEVYGGENWAAFHNGGNTSISAANFPLRWSPEGGLGWAASLPGYGQSAPVVWRDRVYVTAVEGDNRERCFALAIDARTGRSLWTKTFASTVTMKNSYMVSRAAPTPLVDANGVYVLFGGGDLHALSHRGRPLWHCSLFDKERAFQNSHGYGSSPAQTDAAVIVLVDHRGPSYLAAISKATGKLLWKTQRESRSSWTSPHVTRVGSHTQIVVSSGGTVDGYDADTGEQLWSLEGISGNLIPSATVQGVHVFVGASISRNGNSRLAAKSNCCLQITPGEAPGYKLLWRAEKAVCDYASPLVHRGYTYYINKVGVLYCLDATTGRQCYAERIGNPCWAQPIAAGEHVYFFGKKGTTTVVRAGPTFETLATNRLWTKGSAPLPDRSYEYEPESASDPRPRQPGSEYLDPIVYGVAAVDGAFYVRLGTHLFCIRDRQRAGRITADNLPAEATAPPRDADDAQKRQAESGN